MGTWHTLDNYRLGPQRSLRLASTRYHHYLLDGPIGRIPSWSGVVPRYAHSPIPRLWEIVQPKPLSIQHERAYNHRGHGQRQCCWRCGICYGYSYSTTRFLRTKLWMGLQPSPMHIDPDDRIWSGWCIQEGPGLARYVHTSMLNLSALKSPSCHDLAHESDQHSPFLRLTRSVPDRSCENGRLEDFTLQVLLHCICRLFHLVLVPRLHCTVPQCLLLRLLGTPKQRCGQSTLRRLEWHLASANHFRLDSDLGLCPESFNSTLARDCKHHDRSGAFLLVHHHWGPLY